MYFSGLCKGRFPSGLFYLDKELMTPHGIKLAAGTGADFFVAVGTSEPFLSLCENHNLGIISNSNLKPFWWGGDGKNAGEYKHQFPLVNFENIRNYPSNPSLWGDYPVDEPNSKDFPHINEIILQYKKRFGNRLPLINLYPFYGRIHCQSKEEIIMQLGTETYEEYINQYIKEVDLPYICFDYYPFTSDINDPLENSFLENLDIAAKACRQTGREMWVILQAGSWKKDEMPEAHYLEWQLYLSLAFGARAVIFASYSKGWWAEGTSCVNNDGTVNKTYEYVKDLFSVLHSEFGREFLQYEYLFTKVYGDLDSSDERIRPQFKKQKEKELPDNFPGLTIKSDKAIAAGFFRKNDSYALLIVNSHNPFCKSILANVGITLPENREIKFYGGLKVSTHNNAFVEFKLGSGQGVFVSFITKQRF